jgi:hypothetical protein
MSKLFAALVLLLLAHPAAAEVSDKIPSQSSLWLVGAAVGVLAFVAGAWRPLLGFAAGLLALLLARNMHSELMDPFVGPAILSEQGRLYWWAVYGPSGLMVGLAVLGIVVGTRRTRFRTSGRTAP